MSGARRLQTEIDRTLKKVEEGVEIFDEVWEKVYAAQQQNQKEKYEVDLKKEIKKLQRLRDQIKTWLSAHEVKDKGDLTEARKLIESKMEMFKVCEKETKTKAFSKEGLARSERLDPEEQAKDDATNFLQGAVEKLNVQIESTEADVEKLSAGKKNRNKDELARKQSVIQRHLWHISKLEQLIRMLDNDALEVEQVEEIKDDIEFYVDSGTDTEGMDELDPYEDLDLEDIPIAEPASIAPESSTKKKKSDREAAKEEKAKSKDKKGSTSMLTIGRAVKTKDKDDSSAKNSSSVNIAQPSPTLEPSPSTNSSSKMMPSPTKSVTPTPSKTQAAQPSSGASLASILKGNEPVVNTKQHLAQQQMMNQQKQQASLVEQQRLQQQASQQRLQQQLQAASQQKAMDQQRMQQQQQQQQNTQRIQQSDPSAQGSSVSGFSGLMAGLGGAPTTSPLASLGSAPLSDPHTMALPMKSDKVNNATGSGTNKELNNPSDSSSLNNGLSSEDPIFRPASMDASSMANALAALGSSMNNIPSGQDRDFAKLYTPRNPYATHQAYFSAPGPSPVFDEATIFEKFHTDTLFFIFYYQQGTYQQYLAARELKKQSWRFHKKYKTWFQRHEEPQVTTDEYEQGTYVYFDYQGTYDSKSGWCQRIKYDFTFEYEFLEDEL
mmetsp:Transcript_8695/g.11363  ORF Transcript_8695/g.11363 Transcript_8695/m.11363 type:complete len:663 (-) Transcript_8695:67-2055(-)